MSRPKLPSEMHSDYPKAPIERCIYTGLEVYRSPSFEEIRNFYLAHPEFSNEGEYELRCPYCENQLREEWLGCCGEAGHGEWILIHQDDEEPLSNDTPKQAARWAQSALEAGIPLSVIDGKTKLTDHFSESYINDMCNRTTEDGK